MKNIIRRAAYAVVALASMFSVSCSSDLDEITKPSNGSNNTSTSGITKLNASISQEESLATKAVLGDKGSNDVYPITWEVGDQIAVSNTQDAPSVFSAESPGGNTTFALSQDDEPINAMTTGAISAFYPAGMVTDFIDGKYVVNLPEVQKHTEGSFDKEAYLMGAYATVTENSNPNLEFKSLCSVLDLRVTSSYDTQVKRIVIYSTSPLSGKGEVTLNDGTKELKMSSDANTFVTLDCSESTVMLEKNKEKHFYVVVPAQNYTDVKIKVEDIDDNFQIFNNKIEISLKKAKLAPVPLAYNNAKSIPVFEEKINYWWEVIAKMTTNIKKVSFEVNSSRVSTSTAHKKENNSAPIYVSFDKENGTVTFSTPAGSMKSAPNSFEQFSRGRYGFLDQLTEIEGLENIDTSDMTDISAMFMGCKKLTSIDLSNFDTSNVIDMSHMFRGCTFMTSLDLRNLNMSKVEDVQCMFFDCQKLESVSFGEFAVNLKSMGSMFYHCYKLTSVDLSHFNTSNVTDMSGMFYSCYQLASINVDGFDTSNVTDMSRMFTGCPVTTLDLSHFVTSKVKDMHDMFGSCDKMETLDISQFEFSKGCYVNNFALGNKMLTKVYCTPTAKQYLLDNTGISKSSNIEFLPPTKP